MPNMSEIRVKRKHFGVFVDTYAIDQGILEEVSGKKNPKSLSGKTIEEQLAIANKARLRHAKAASKRTRVWE